MRLPDIDGKTAIYGILGHPVTSSLSPAMQNAAFAALGINARYLPLPLHPDSFDAGIRGVRALGIAGFNLTLPHKTAILPQLDEISPQAAAIGAVNTVRNVDGGLSGTNTDGAGFIMSLEQDLGWRAEGRRVLMLGAGGAARGIGYSLLEQGAAELTIVNRSEANAADLANSLHDRFSGRRIASLPMDHGEALRADLLVNTTTLGMGDGASPLDLTTVEIADAVADIVYSPAETPLLKQAKSLGLARTNGIGMLLYQGALAFHFWTGREAPFEIMRNSLMAGLAARD